MSSNSGGAAASGGIDFQQRVAAYFMIQMLFDLKSLVPIGVEGEYEFLEISFETASSIDDIEVITKSLTLYIQAKRSINLSSSKTSEFVKVIRQFVDQYISSKGKKDKYLLVTTSDASAKIKKEFKKILESVRLNDTGFESNPLNKSEKETYEKIRQSVFSAYSESSGKTLSENDFVDILKRIHIIIFDIQSGMPLESALLTLLASQATINPEIIWSIIIKLALSLSSNRQSLNKKGLKDSLGKYLSNCDTDIEKKLLTNEVIKIKSSESELQAGREVLLIKSFDKNFDYIIVELNRFDELGKRDLKFYDNKCQLPNGNIWEVIHRAATQSGLQRFVEGNADKYKDKKLAILSNETEDDYDLSEFALAHAELCKKMITDSTEPLNCIKCGDFVSEDVAPFVEIDCTTRDHTIGIIHKKCLEPIDRVIGKIDAEIFRQYDFLKDFDYITWFNQLQGGQGLFNGVHGNQSQILQMGWKSDALRLSKGKYCIKIDLEDGSSRYVHDRGKVLRQSLAEAESNLSQFIDTLQKGKSDKDPWCYTSKIEKFGKYSTLEKIKDNDEECIECINAEIVLCTKTIEDVYGDVKNFYAPVFILLEKDSGLPLLINNALFILNNPLELDRYLKNWAKADMNVSDYSIKIIKTDEEFDLHMAQLLQDGVQVLANPKFNMQGELLSGIVFRDFNELMFSHNEE